MFKHGKKNQKPRLNTHEKTMKHAKTMRIEMDVDSPSASSSDVNNNNNNNNTSNFKPDSPCSKPSSSDRVFNVFGGYDLSMTQQRQHPLQSRTYTHFFDQYKEMHFQNQNKTDLNDYVEQKYIQNFDPFEETKVWPHTRFLRQARADRGILQLANSEDVADFSSSSRNSTSDFQKKEASEWDWLLKYTN